MPTPRRLSLLLLVILLAACNGPTTQTVPPPAAASFAPRVALPGETVAITGTDLGESGQVTIGGAAAEVVSWADTRVVVEVPAEAPPAWQQLVITNPAGRSQLDGFFVGAEFTGEAEDLQEFLLGTAMGTAILLQAEEYDLSGTDELIIDNRSLYGRGPDETSLILPPNPTSLLADFGRTVTIADLTMEGNSFFMLHGNAERYLSTMELTGLNQAFAPGAHEAFASLSHDAPEALELASGSVPAAEFTNFTFRGVGVGGFGAFPIVAQPLLDVSLTDVSLELADSVVMFLTMGDLDLNRTTIHAEVLTLGALSRSVSVEEATLVGELGLQLGADAGLTVTDSTLRATNGELVLLGALLTEVSNGEVMSGGPITITGSSIESLDADLTDASRTGGIEISTLFAPITIRDNALLRAHDDLAVWASGSGLGDGRIVLSGNPDVRVGVFKDEDAANFRRARLVIGTQGGEVPDLVTLEDNVITVTELAWIYLGHPSHPDAGPSDLVMRGNDMMAGDGEGIGRFLVEGEAGSQLELADNKFTLDRSSSFDVELGGVTARFMNNEFSIVGVSPVLGIDLRNGSCELAGNTFTVETNDPLIGEEFSLDCGSGVSLAESHRFDDNRLTFGSAPSRLSLIFEGGTTSVSGNEVSGGSWFSIRLGGTDAKVIDNTITGLDKALYITGGPDAELDLIGNSVRLLDTERAGLWIEDVGSSTVVDNDFTHEGVLDPLIVAFEVANYAGSPMQVTATGNTFTNFGKALYVYDDHPGTSDLDLTITHNVFDFPINAAPQVATLNDIKDTVDARHNVWGTNTDLAAVASYVAYEEGTTGYGGGILLDPIGLPE